MILKENETTLHFIDAELLTKCSLLDNNDFVIHLEYWDVFGIAKHHTTLFRFAVVLMRHRQNTKFYFS